MTKNKDNLVKEENIDFKDVDIDTKKSIEPQYSLEEKIRNRNNWVIIIVSIIFVITLSCKLIFGELKLDLSTTLTFLLSFFSIALSALFYFKATEQSNAFYDRSYTHTKDIAESLSRMQGEFGKSLHLLEDYSNKMNNKFDNIPWQIIKQSEETLESAQKDKNEILSELYEKAGISEEERKKYNERISEREQIITTLKEEINELKHFNPYQKNNTPEFNNNIDKDFLIDGIVIPFISFLNINTGGTDINDLSIPKIQGVFSEYTRQYNMTALRLDILRNHRLIDKNKNLTTRGALFIRDVANKK